MMTTDKFHAQRPHILSTPRPPFPDPGRPLEPDRGPKPPDRPDQDPVREPDRDPDDPPIPPPNPDEQNPPIHVTAR